MEQIGENIYLYPAHTNTGILTDNNRQAVIIDTGIDQSGAKKLLRELEQHQLKLTGIINTHSHADHVGGNAFLTRHTGAMVYSPRWEAPFQEFTLLEPYYLIGGAYPWQDLQGKFLCAPASPVNRLIEEGPLAIGDITVEIIPLPGHSIDQVGVACHNILFTGDAFISPSLLKKHVIPFNVNISDYLNSLHRLAGLDYALYIPSHSEPCSDPGKVIEANRNMVLSQVEKVWEFIKSPKTTEEILTELCNHLQLTIPNAVMFFLYRTTVLAYLSFLHQQQRASATMWENKLIWETV